MAVFIKDISEYFFIIWIWYNQVWNSCCIFYLINIEREFIRFSFWLNKSFSTFRNFIDDWTHQVSNTWKISKTVIMSKRNTWLYLLNKWGVYYLFILHKNWLKSILSNMHYNGKMSIVNLFWKIYKRYL